MRASVAGVVVCVLLGSVPSACPTEAARRQRLDFRRFEVEIAGPPVAILAGDVNRDGRSDLLVVTAYTYWGQTGDHGTREFEGRLIESVTVVPSLIDRRELRLFTARADGGFEPAGTALALDRSVHAFAEGPSEHPFLALTDDGVATVIVKPAADGDSVLGFETLVREPTVLAGSGVLLPRYDFTEDVDGDGRPELLVPVATGVAIYRFDGGTPRSSGVIALPGRERGKNGIAWYDHPLPRVERVDGDERPDLVVYHADEGRRLIRFDNRPELGAISFLPGRGDGTFGPPVRVHRERQRFGQAEQPVHGSVATTDAARIGEAELPGELLYFGDLDGDGRSELVSRERQDRTPGKNGLRAEMRETKCPLFRYGLFRVAADGSLPEEPYDEFDGDGYPFDFDMLQQSPGGLVDLDDDGSKELVTLCLDFSLWQVPKVLTTKKIGAGLEFHVWSRTAAGHFAEVPGDSPSGKMRIGLGEMRFGRLAQFAGDFDGDGRVDFVQLGGDRKVDIHCGRAGARYEAKPDLILTLAEAPRDIGLVRVRDLDGDDRSDLLVVTPLRADEDGESQPNRIEFYLSGGAP